MEQLPRELLPPINFHSFTVSSAFLDKVQAAIEEMGSRLQELDLQSQRNVEAFEELKGEIEGKLHIPRSVKAIEGEWRFELRVVEFPAMPLYVKRRFDVGVRIEPRDSRSGTLPFPVCLNLTVHKLTSSTEEILTTRKGTPMLKGQTTKMFTTSGTLTFNDVVFYEVSNRFPHGRVQLIVKCVNRSDVRPLVIEGVRVKARKVHINEVF